MSRRLATNRSRRRRRVVMGSVSAPSAPALLMETGFFLLLETGGRILLE